jgi:hypothetical protein
MHRWQRSCRLRRPALPARRVEPADQRPSLSTGCVRTCRDPRGQPGGNGPLIPRGRVAHPALSGLPPAQRSAAAHQAGRASHVRGSGAGAGCWAGAGPSPGGSRLSASAATTDDSAAHAATPSDHPCVRRTHKDQAVSPSRETGWGCFGILTCCPAATGTRRRSHGGEPGHPALPRLDSHLHR